MGSGAMNEYKGAWGVFWDYADVLYLDWGCSYKVVYICQNSFNCVFKMSVFY